MVVLEQSCDNSGLCWIRVVLEQIGHSYKGCVCLKL